MSVIINASSTSGLVISNDMSGTLQFQQNGVNLPMSGLAPCFGAYPNPSVTQTITSGSQQKVLFQLEEYDTNNNFANSRFTPTVPGYYQLNATVRLDGSYSTGESMIVIWKNGSEHKRGWNASGSNWAASFGSMSVNSLVYANGTTDYFEIYVQQTSGGGSSVTNAGGNITYFNGFLARGA
jgi:hypothetical protein